MHRRSNKLQFIKIFIISCVVLALMLLAVMLYSRFVTKDCASASCLAERAEKCLPTTYTEVMDNMVIEHRTGTDCIASSKIVGFTESVPQDYANRFIGKELTCQYSKGQYQTGILESDTQICTFT